MKTTTLFASLIISISCFAQSSIVPKEIKFDRNVLQKVSDKKTTTLSYYFTESGEYAALQPEEKNTSTMIIYNKEGKMMIVNEKEKSIMVMDMKPFLDRMMKKGEEMAKTQKDTSSKRSTGSFRKTGNTKTIAGYPADEYEITTEKGKMNIWYAKTDFASFPILAMGMMNPMGGKNAAASNEFSDLPGLGRNFFMAEMEKDSKKVIETVSISKTDYIFSSAGYTIRDMSDLLKGNYGQ